MECLPELSKGGGSGRSGLGLIDPAGESDWRVAIGEGVGPIDEHGR